MVKTTNQMVFNTVLLCGAFFHDACHFRVFGDGRAEKARAKLGQAS